jgi:predicted GIY-YIG superfamily endonuclease
MKIIKMLTIYALQLETNKFYIGKTNRNEGVDIRFQEHKSGRGSEWTKLYKPVSIIEYYEHDSTFEEDVLTKKYMIKYGIENVRGGSYTKIELDEWQIKSLEHEFKSVSDSCYKCGKKGHFAIDCHKFDNLNKYLSRFTSEDELVSEISNMEKLRDYFINETCIIDHLKYVVYQEYHGEGRNKQSIQQKIEIYPSAIIDAFDYNNFVYDEMYCVNTKNPAVRLYREHIIKKCHVDGIIPENVIETIYRIYVNRLKRERQLKKLIDDNGLSEIDCLKEINKRIEHLYKKYADLLTYSPTTKYIHL